MSKKSDNANAILEDFATKLENDELKGNTFDEANTIAMKASEDLRADLAHWADILQKMKKQ